MLTSPEMEELKRITEWAKKTTDGSLSDLVIGPATRNHFYRWAQMFKCVYFLVLKIGVT